eukprot:g1588.t1
MGSNLSVKVAGNGVATVTGDAESCAKIFCNAPPPTSTSNESVLPGGKYIIQVGGGTNEEEWLKMIKSLKDENTRLLHQLQSISNVVGGMQIMTEVQDFNVLMNKWLDSPDNSDQRSLAEDVLIGKFMKSRTVLVSDMSGFSRICQEEGIVHFLSLVKIMQAFCVPLAEEYGGELVKVAADNMFFSFENSTACVTAACAMMQAAKMFSKGKSKNDSIVLSMGIATGSCWLLKGTDVFGDTANIAFQLGENISNNEILVTEPVRQDLANADPDKVLFKIEKKKECGVEEVYAVNHLKPFEISFPESGFHCILNGPINSEEPPAFVKLVNERIQMKSREEKAMVDYQMKVRFMKKRCVLVIEMHDQGDKLREVGILRYISLILQLRRVCSGQIDLHHGSKVTAVDNKIVGQVFALFNNCRDALMAAISCVKAAEGMNFSLAIGLGFGEVLDLDGKNVFGDPVNMAFKLAEDVSKANEILLTLNVFNELGEVEIEFEERKVELSGISIKHKSVIYDSAKASSIRKMAAASTVILGWNKSAEGMTSTRKQIDIGGK